MFVDSERSPSLVVQFPEVRSGPFHVCEDCGATIYPTVKYQDTVWCEPISKLVEYTSDKCVGRVAANPTVVRDFSQSDQFCNLFP